MKERENSDHRFLHQTWSEQQG
uniref:Uncharacterized protein n=1 Tax=Anguilla anguilla TaxID=7936 RepID=A0A0E9TH96_ANGAN